MHPTEDLLYQAAQQGVEPADRYRAPEGMSRSRQEAARRHVSYPVSDSMSCRRRAKQHGSRTVLTSRPRSALCALPPRESELLRHSIPRDSTAACARADRATCSSSGSSPASAAPSSTWSTLCRPCRPAAWVCGCSPGKARRSTPPPRHHRVRALPRTRDHPRDALAVRRAARPVARARPEGSRSANRRAPARTGECENVLRPAARWPSLGGPSLGRFLYCFLPNSPDRVVTRRRGSACNTLSAIRALPALRRGTAASWSAHATAPGHQERHRCCSSWPG